MVWEAVAGMLGSQIIGMVLYSKSILGRPWMRATFRGKTEDQINELQKQTFHVSLVFCLLSQLVLVLAIHYILGPYLGVKTIEKAVKVGLALQGISLLVDIPHCLFSQRAVTAFLIDHIYNGLVLVTACVSYAYFG